MRLLLAVLLGKVIISLTRLLKLGGGSAAPGLCALKVDPNLVRKLSSQIPKSVVITGTNGKTTTARLLSHLLASQHLKILRNHTGSNLERGIASTIIKNLCLHLRGVKLKFDIAVWELDEAAFNKLAPILNPDIIIFLNVLRDQLDRYGEVDNVVKNWCQSLKTLNPKSKILINGDDQNLLQLMKCFKGKVLAFGLQTHKIKGEAVKLISKPAKLDFEARDIKQQGLSGTSFVLQNTKYTIPIPGFYHIYDVTAAMACARLLFSDAPMHSPRFRLGSTESKRVAGEASPKAGEAGRYADTLKDYSPAFGRFEKFVLQPGRLGHGSQTGGEGFIFLIKNPVGATQVFETIASHIKPGDRLLIALNDNFADGKDVSWIWDAEWERLQVTGYRLQVICSGTRAHDLVVRLKYAGFDPKLIVIESNLKKAFKRATEGLKGRIFILPTYTALLELQKILTRAGLKSHYWQEEDKW